MDSEPSHVSEIAAKYRNRQRERLRRRSQREMQRARRLYITLLLTLAGFVLLSIGFDLRRQARYAEYRREAFALQSAGRDPDRAASLLEKVLANDPDDSGAYYRLGLLIEAHEPQKAVEYFERAADLPGATPVLLSHLGDVLARIHRKHSATLAYRRYLEMARNAPGETAEIRRVEAAIRELSGR